MSEKLHTPQPNTELWQYGQSGSLEPSFYAKASNAYYKEATDIVAAPGLVDDISMAHTMAHAENSLRTEREALNQRDSAFIMKLGAIAIQKPNAGAKQALATAEERITNRNAEDLSSRGEVVAVVQQELSARSKAELQAAITSRIEANKLPWTMPNPKISKEEMDRYKGWYNAILGNTITEPAKPDDVFKVAIPVGNGGKHAAKDIVLLAEAGVKGDKMTFTREELQRAGVFFVNRVGGGEQPIFGMPIPDPESEGGFFNVQDRNFLTRAELEKVYKYQQENGYGIGGADAADVQTDMIVFALRADGRRPDARKDYGGAGRENKYGVVRSPFVDSNYYVTAGFESVVRTPEGSQRMNTVTIHLANGHPDFPGLSEMPDPNTTAGDQKYMTAGKFVEEYYKRLPTEEEALGAMRNNMHTDREKAWVGGE